MHFYNVFLWIFVIVCTSKPTLYISTFVNIFFATITNININMQKIYKEAINIITSGTRKNTS